MPQQLEDEQQQIDFNYINQVINSKKNMMLQRPMTSTSQEVEYDSRVHEETNKQSILQNVQQQMTSYRSSTRENYSHTSPKFLGPLPDSFNDNGKSFTKARRVLISEQVNFKTPGPGYYASSFANKQSPSLISFTKSPRQCVFDKLSKSEAPDKFYDTKIRYLSKKPQNR